MAKKLHHKMRDDYVQGIDEDCVHCGHNVVCAEIYDDECSVQLREELDAARSLLVECREHLVSLDRRDLIVERIAQLLSDE